MTLPIWCACCVLRPVKTNTDSSSCLTGTLIFVHARPVLCTGVDLSCPTMAFSKPALHQPVGCPVILCALSPDRPVRPGGELPHQDPVRGAGGGVAGHGGPAALRRPLVPADHPLPAPLLQHHPHQVSWGGPGTALSPLSRLTCPRASMKKEKLLFLCRTNGRSDREVSCSWVGL